MSTNGELEKAAEEAAGLRAKSMEMLGRNLVGLEGAIDQILVALIAGGHALLEGVPGTAKTTLCRYLASVLGLDYHRIQFTPDLLPSDVTGTRIFDQTTGKFVLQRGPVFCQFLLADELNRAPARTQSSLLEAMQERQVTIEGETLELPAPFMVLATQNPVEQEGVYRLPEAQLDRFLFRIRVDYPDRESELKLLTMQDSPPKPVETIWSTQMTLRLRQLVDEVHGSSELKEYLVDLIRASREHADVLLGASPRAAIYLMRAAKARAMLHGRVFYTHEDVQEMLHGVLEHRVIIRPESELSGKDATEVVDDVIRAVPVRVIS